MKFKPMQDRILVREIVPTSSGGVVLPDTAQHGPKWGVVLAVGDGSRFQTGLQIPVRVNEGQRVMFARHSGEKITVDTEQLLMLREGEIMGVFEEDESASGTSTPATLHSVR
jgi:chaperonin GroES